MGAKEKSSPLEILVKNSHIVQWGPHSKQAKISHFCKCRRSNFSRGFLEKIWDESQMMMSRYPCVCYKSPEQTDWQLWCIATQKIGGDTANGIVVVAEPLSTSDATETDEGEDIII